jgi:hypothetical protein
MTGVASNYSRCIAGASAEIYIYKYIYIYVYNIYLSIHPSIHLSVCLSIYLSIKQSTLLPTYLPTSLPAYVPTYPSTLPHIASLSTPVGCDCGMHFKGCNVRLPPAQRTHQILADDFRTRFAERDLQRQRRRTQCAIDSDTNKHI